MVVMGQLGTPFGVKGWVRIFADTEYPDSLLDYSVWYLETATGWQAFDIEAAEMHAKGLVAMRNRKIAVPRSELPETEDGEYYWSDLIGLSVVNLAGESLGKVTQLLETGANDVLVIRDANVERLLPFVDAVVKTVDIAAALITVDWGLDY